MDITLKHDEIVLALTEYVGGQGIDLNNKSIEVNLVAGRSGNGYTATIAIDSALDAPIAEKATIAAKPAKATRKVSKNSVLNALALDELDPKADDVEEDAQIPFDLNPPEDKAPVSHEDPVVVADAQPAKTGESEPVSTASLFA